MQTLRRIRTKLTLLVLLVGSGLCTAAHAAPSGIRDTLHLKNVTIPWLFSLANPANGGFCASIPASVGFINPVDNDSDRVRKVTSELLADGSQVIEQDDLKKGTAVDDSGAIYRFIYKNHLVLIASPGAPANVSVRMIDSFRLTGNGVNMNAIFDWSWDYAAPDGVVLNLQPDADFPVDFFIFATSDGVNPADGVTNWQQLKTQGDPFNCDPL
jgi:hypothetical protein